jgi:hypothetical protein
VIERLRASLQGLIDIIVAAVPNVMAGIVLLLLGVVVAKIIEKVLRAFLVRLRFDSLIGRAGLDKTLQRIGIREQLSQSIPRLIYFLLLSLLTKTVADSLGLAAISDAFAAFFSYLPNIFAAFLVLILGSAVSQFVGDAVKNAGENAGIDFAASLGRMVSGLLMFIIGVMAISQLKFDTEMLRIVTSFVLAAAALAFGISFGLGSREITRNVLAGFYARKILQVGERLEIRGQTGVLRSITATHAILEQDAQSISVANATFLDEIAKQSPS